MLDRAALTGGSPSGEHVIGYREFLRREAELLAGRLHLVLAERGAVSRRGALFVGRAVTDDRPAADEARAGVGDGLLDGAADVVGVEAVALAGMPLRRLVPSDHVLVARQ